MIGVDNPIFVGEDLIAANFETMYYGYLVLPVYNCVFEASFPAVQGILVTKELLDRMGFSAIQY